MDSLDTRPPVDDDGWVVVLLLLPSEGHNPNTVTTTTPMISRHMTTVPMMTRLPLRVSFLAGVGVACALVREVEGNFRYPR